MNIFLWSLRSPLRGGFTVYLKLWHCQEQHRAIMVATLFVGEYMYKRACWGAINKSLVTHADYSSTGFSAIRLWRGMIRLWWGMGITSVRQNTSARRTSPIFGTYVRRRALKTSDTMAYMLFYAHTKNQTNLSTISIRKSHFYLAQILQFANSKFFSDPNSSILPHQNPDNSTN